MIAKLVFVVLFAFCAEAVVLVNNPIYCYSWDPVRPQRAMFSTVTAYDEVRGQSINPTVSSCTPSRIWYQGRHGSRFPSVADNDNLLSASDTINEDIIRNYNSLRTTLCPSDADLIRNWQIVPEFTLPTQGVLTDSGWSELSRISSRLQDAFPSLLPKEYSAGHYYFRHSPIPRTLSSARAFASGLFGTNNVDLVNYEGGFSPDNYLVPFNGCPAWYSFFFDVPEVEIFTRSTNYQQMLRQVSAKLGFHGDQELNSTRVEQLVNHCTYEQLYNRNSPSAFCSAFSIANHQVNEYLRDLGFSFASGYGNTANRRLYENMSCNLLQAMLQFLQSSDPSDQKAKLWFGHDITLQFMMVALGLYEDEVPLTGSNFAQQTNRKWKTSQITPMGGNIAVIRYDCADGDNDILFLHNERPLQIPGCSSDGVCKQSHIMQRYSRYLTANCDAIFCTNN